MNFFFLKKIYDIFTTTTEVQPKRQLLEPLTTMFRIASLTIMEKYTKIRIDKNRIIFQEPNLFQGVERWYNGDKKTDIHNLYAPIKYFILWKEDVYEDENIQYVVKHAILGLEFIKTMYKNNDLVQQVVHHYIIMLKNPKDIYKEEKDKSANLFYEKMKDLWSDKDIKIGVDLITKIKTIKDKEQKKYFKNALHSYLDGKDFYVHEYLTKISTGKEYNN
jgi:hypothetical protein